MSSRSSLIWVCTVCPDLSILKPRIITVGEQGRQGQDCTSNKGCNIIGFSGQYIFFFGNYFFSIVVAMYDLVHDMKTIFYLC